MPDRGVSEVMGVVLLVGLVSIAALSLLVVGTVVVDGLESEIETEQAEESMVVTADRADQVATGEQITETWSFEGAGDGTLSVDDEAGRLNITQYVDGEPETVVLDDVDIGAFTYEDDGTEFAYQAGAVWRLDEHGEPVLVRAPDIYYAGGTLTFPFKQVTGELDGAPVGELAATEPKNVYPELPDDRNPLRGGTVLIEIESDYCAGWESYFDQRTEGALLERCADTENTADGELVTELVVPFEFAEADESIWAENIRREGSPEINDDREGAVDLPSADRVVSEQRERCAGTFDDDIKGTVDEARLHCTTDVDPSSDLKFDTADGDIGVYVDGTVDFDNTELRITGPNDVTFYVGETVDLRVADINCHKSDGDCQADPSQLRMLLTEHESGDPAFGAVNASGTPSEIGALVYAQNADTELRGAVHFEGTIIANQTIIQGGDGSVSVSFDERMRDIDIEYEFGGQSIYFLHVTETELTFRDD